MFKLYSSSFWAQLNGKNDLLKTFEHRNIRFQSKRILFLINLIVPLKYSDYAHITCSNSRIGMSSASLNDFFKNVLTKKIVIFKNLRVSELDNVERLIILRNRNVYFHIVGAPWLKKSSAIKKSRDLKRLRKKVDNIVFKSIELSVLQDSIMDDILHLLQDGLIRKGVNSKEISRLKTFLHNVRIMPKPEGIDFLADLLFVDNNLVAAHIGIKAKSTYLYWLPCYDVKYRSISPGQQLLFSILDNAKSAGIELVDFGNGDEPYKRWFATGSLCSISGISL